MKKYLFLTLLFTALVGIQNAKGQIIIYAEDFDGVASWTINADLGAEG